MPRAARVVYPGYLHHVTHRGNNRQRLFFDDNDHILYLKYVERYRVKYGVDIYAYCLMGNHVHFILSPRRPDSLAKLFHIVHLRYAQYFQKKTSSCGHVWQGRFYSCLLSGEHLREAFRYIENNPVRANMTTKPWHYAWSSARAHLGKQYKWITLADANAFIEIRHWKMFLERREDEAFVKKIRHMTNKNLALGTKEFLIALEKKLGRKIIPSPKGRPRKNK